jgi:two-component system NtrC family response regulator
VLEGAFVMTDGQISVTSLPPEIRQKSGETAVVEIPVESTLEQMERQMISAALLHYGGNRVQTAKSLGIGRKTLYRKIEEFGLE